MSRRATNARAAPRLQILFAEKAYDILKNISNEDCVLLGFNPKFARPDWMVLTVLPVPPPHVRPAIQMDSSTRGEDDLTFKLTDILKRSKILKRQLLDGAAGHVLDTTAALLGYHIATYMDNEINGCDASCQTSGKPIKSIRQRIRGKDGRVRGNLMGKRVDFSARTVITADPNLSIDEVGVPRSIANNLTYPEIVTVYNRQQMHELVQVGPSDPTKRGARYIIRLDGTRRDLRYVGSAGDITLELGEKVERHLMDGDPIIFNRQPSLHKMSIMGHRVRIMPYSTFRLNLSCTSPYNADFDGDEMNLHVPQTPETRSEVLNIMMSPRQIVSPQGNRPVMGIVQDSLLGATKLTSRNTFIEKDLMFNILMWLKSFDGNIPAPAILKPKPLWTGKQVISLIIPNVNVQKVCTAHPDGETAKISPGDTKVVIDQGELICGITDKPTLGASQGGLIHIIWNEHGPEVTRVFMDQIQQLVNYWLLQESFSIGIADGIADEITMGKIVETIEKAKMDVKEKVGEAQRKALECTPGRTLMETFEDSVNRTLNTARDDAGKTATNSISGKNNMRAMVVAGSKGSNINIAQVIACVGQQNVEGKRIPFGFRRRTLPHFAKDDFGPESRGFVENSYLKGLTPQEFFFHAMGGREGLIDTAVKTSETGYIQRRLVKAMEDVSVRYDQTIRNSLGNVIEFLYGEDGMDGTAIEQQSLELLKVNLTKFESKYRWNFDRDDWFKDSRGRPFLDKDVVERISRSAASKERLVQEGEKLEGIWNELRRRKPLMDSDKRWMPVNVARIVMNAQRLFKIDSRSKDTSLDPLKCIEGLEQLEMKLEVVKGSDPLSKEAQHNATMMIKYLLHGALASKIVCRDYRLSEEAWDWVLGEIEIRWFKSLGHVTFALPFFFALHRHACTHATLHRSAWLCGHASLSFALAGGRDVRISRRPVDRRARYAGPSCLRYELCIPGGPCVRFPMDAGCRIWFALYR